MQFFVLPQHLHRKGRLAIYMPTHEDGRCTEISGDEFILSTSEDTKFRCQHLRGKAPRLGDRGTITTRDDSRLITFQWDERTTFFADLDMKLGTDAKLIKLADRWLLR